MEKDNIFLIIKEIILEKLDVNEMHITPEKSPRIDLGADSLDEVNLFIEYEIKFRIIIYDKYYPKLKTIKDCIIYINNYLNNKKEENEEYFKIKH